MAITTTPRVRGPNQELHIATIPGEDEWPDASQVWPIALAHIPLPATWQTRLNEQVAYMPTAQRARQITKANSYEELWPIFATRASTVPKAFTQMYLSDVTSRMTILGTAIHVPTTCTVVTTIVGC